MLGVEQRLAFFGHDRGNGLGDIFEVLAARNLERDIDLEIPALADKAERGRLGGKEGGQSRIVAGAAARANPAPSQWCACLRRKSRRPASAPRRAAWCRRDRCALSRSPYRLPNHA